MIDPNKLDELLRIPTGEPEWVMVDRRVMRILLGPLADIIVQVPMDAGRNAPGFDELAVQRHRNRREYDPDQDGYIWADDNLCDGD